MNKHMEDVYMDELNEYMDELKEEYGCDEVGSCEAQTRFEVILEDGFGNEKMLELVSSSCEDIYFDLNFILGLENDTHHIKSIVVAGLENDDFRHLIYGDRYVY